MIFKLNKVLIIICVQQQWNFTLFHDICTYVFFLNNKNFIANNNWKYETLCTLIQLLQSKFIMTRWIVKNNITNRQYEIVNNYCVCSKRTQLLKIFINQTVHKDPILVIFHSNHVLCQCVIFFSSIYSL